MKALLQDTLLRLMRYAPPSAMTIDNLYAYLDALYQLRDIDGPVVEIGCARGGTTIQACRFLSRIGATKEYFCFDTFGGFVKEQLETDHQLGLSPRHDHFFRDNSEARFRAALATMDIRDHVHLVKADICQVEDSAIPEQVSVGLVDVDLRDPVYAGLEKLYPRLAPGGVILVDDCKQGTSWVGADVGYSDFINNESLEPKYFLGFGVVESPVRSEHGLSWSFSASPNPIRANFFAE